MLYNLLRVTKLVRGKAKIHPESVRSGHTLCTVTSHEEGHGQWDWEQKIDLGWGHEDTEQPETTRRQMSEREALGTEKAVTKRTEASFKSSGGGKSKNTVISGNNWQRTDL